MFEKIADNGKYFYAILISKIRKASIFMPKVSEKIKLQDSFRTCNTIVTSQPQQTIF